MRYAEFGRPLISLRDIHAKKLKKQREAEAEKERHQLMQIMYGNKDADLDRLERELEIAERIDKLGMSDKYDRSHIQKMANRYLSKT